MSRELIADAALWLWQNRKVTTLEMLQEAPGASILWAFKNAREVLTQYRAEPLSQWWGLSYATWLTLPRVLMEAMPEDWQARMGALLKEYDAAYPSQPDLGTHIRVSQGGKLVPCPQWLLNYRHPDAAEIAKCREVPLRCWSCKKLTTLEARTAADGHCPHCDVEIER